MLLYRTTLNDLLWYAANMTDDILDKNLVKIKKENEKLYPPNIYAVPFETNFL